jgi:hypothetical protein
MGSILGYILSGVGLVTLALGSDKIKGNIAIIKDIPSLYINLIGGALLVGGIAFLAIANKGSSTVKQAQEEVPIYQGEGKNRKIVGYRKA